VAVASIIISEADPDVRRLLSVLMERQGHEAVALDRRVEIPPRGDLLLLEPTVEWCVEQARVARHLDPDLPIVCMGFLPRGAAKLAAGPIAFLEKPFSVEALEAAVAALVPSPI
jgi:DNA-binding response OmpR family regulator